MQHQGELSRLAAMLGGLPVLGCRAGSPAARAGVRYGDIVLSVNGVPTPDWGAYVEARARATGEMSVEIFRDGATIVHTLAFDDAPVDPMALVAELIDARVLPDEADDDHDGSSFRPS